MWLLRYLIPSLILLSCLRGSSFAQGTRADYERSANLEKRWGPAFASRAPKIRWLPYDQGAWFVRKTSQGHTQYVRVDVSGKVSPSDTPDILGVQESSAQLEPQSRLRRSRNSSTDSSITFENQLDEVVLLYWRDAEGTKRPYGEIQARSKREQHTFAGHAWIAENSHGKVVGVFVAGDEPGIARINSTSVEAAARIQDPDSPKTDSKAEPLKPGCFVRSWNLWHRSAGLEEVALSQGGTETNAYLSDFHTSPNGEHALVFQEQRGQGRQIQFVESSPGDQVQPRIHSLSYDKPGDRIAQRIPRLFDIKQRSQIPVEEHHFTNAWSLGHLHWNEESDEVFLLYNARGHQSQRILGIQAGTGKVRTVLEETSATFIDYSQKTYLHWLKGSRQFLWASERSGRNHLYLIDAGSGEARPVTQGGWILRRVEKVDEAAGRIFFTALGLHRNQDPYHRHLARIGIDGRDLTVLTHSDGDHEWEFSPGGALFATRWSRVDHPPVSELRRTSDGSLVTELDRTDATGITTNGFRPPIRFVAKGRDGVTDIHGILILPSQFDPSRKYPVLEDIYAGPHDFHVPKRWGLGLRQRKLAELGFIVAQIDGMGTNWREKSFHDYCWRNLRDGGFPDRIAWLKAAASTLPAMDLERVGIFGGSAGGQNALAALLHHGDFYKAAVADCGCHDNRMDKIWWNEAWMGYPVGPWYSDNSNVTHASKLKGKLLLTLGELDRNVDPASTMQVVNALIKADKDFDFITVPGAGHGVGESPYLQRRRMDFFVRHLWNREPRQE